MKYCIVNTEHVIENIIVCEDDATAAEFGAVPSYEGVEIGTSYDPPPAPPTLEERVGTLETTKAEQKDVVAIAAAIERGLSL